jgi:hypothetical protein
MKTNITATQQSAYLTRSKYDAYEQQLEYMEKEGSRKLSRLLASAPGSGMGRPMDLPIHDLARLFYAEIDELRFKITHAVFIEDIVNSYSDTSICGIGATIAITELSSMETDVYTILGSDEANPSFGVISYLSPIGASVMGKKIGDVVVLKTNGLKFRIDEVEYRPLDIKNEPKDWDTILNTHIT